MWFRAFPWKVLEQGPMVPFQTTLECGSLSLDLGNDYGIFTVHWFIR